MSMALRVWITRTQPGADATAERVRLLGWEPVVAPLLEVHALKGAMQNTPAPETLTALALTSPNTVLAIKDDLAAFSQLPVYAVGDTTSEAARKAGLPNVQSAKGDIHALAQLIASQQPVGTVFAPGAKEPAGDLAALLPQHSVIRLPVYETVETGTAIPAQLTAVLVHSPRAARILAGRLNACEVSGLQIIAISEAAKTPLNGISGLEIRTSSTPDEEGVLTTLGNSPSPV